MVVCFSGKKSKTCMLSVFLLFFLMFSCWICMICTVLCFLTVLFSNFHGFDVQSQWHWLEIKFLDLHGCFNEKCQKWWEANSFLRWEAREFMVRGKSLQWEATIYSERQIPLQWEDSTLFCVNFYTLRSEARNLRWEARLFTVRGGHLQW